jgi:hypothetical protein
MKRLICAVAVVMACLVMVGGALANTYTDHVTTAPNGKGDLLFYPVYLAAEGLETKITVINTSLTQSVVAKVVVKSSAYSQELLDFLIYLSPTDMWVGTLKHGANGPVMSSTDASGPIMNPGQPLVAAKCAGDTNEIGYVEIIEAWSGSLGLPVVSKAKIKDAYDALIPPFLPTDTINTLAGSYQISIPVVGWEAADNAVVLKDYDNRAKLTPTVLTILGVGALNNIQEIDAAINKDFIAMTYNSSDDTGGTLHLFTFPTKQSNYTSCSRASTSLFFPADGKVKYKTNMFDNEELTTTDPDNPFSPQDPALITMDDEVNFKAMPAGIFDFGWALYSFTEGATDGTNLSGQVLNYDGAPVIPAVIDFKDGLSIRSAAWTDGTVTGATGPIPGYQYTSGAAVTAAQ